MKQIISMLSVSFMLQSISLAKAEESQTTGISEHQQFTVKNNGTIIATVSKREISRIVFDSEVDSIHSIAGEAEANTSGKDLYIRTSIQKPLNFFVKTVDGFTYKFVLEVMDIPATQIFVHKQSATKRASDALVYKQDHINPDLKKRISQIIEQTLRPKKYLGYEIDKEKVDLDPVHNIALKQIGKVSGKKLIAERIVLINYSNHAQKLQLQDFMSPEYLAVYLTKTVLEASEHGTLIKIKEEK